MKGSKNKQANKQTELNRAEQQKLTANYSNCIEIGYLVLATTDLSCCEAFSCYFGAFSLEFAFRQPFF